jgi:hypothetical protein
MNTLVDVAFGDAPGRWPLPSASTPREHWLRAVASGGQGRYAAAMAELDWLDRATTCPALASLAFSTRASLLRQLGGHLVARGWDGRAWAAAGSDVDAGADALVGLAADALGVGRFAVSQRLLRRAGDLIGDGAAGRLGVRLAWVSAELAMVMGDGAAAVDSAERAVELAVGFTSARHAVKSQVVLAAAWCSVGEFDTSRNVADAALTVAERLGLVPLNWALACVLADIGSSVHSPTEIRARRDGLADTVRDRGGTWTAR